MAMINCPECGQEISDKAKKCIHCGKVFIEEEIVQEEIKCIECGAVLSVNDEICPNCGCPVEKICDTPSEKVQQVQLTSIKTGSKAKKVVIAVVIALIVCIGAGVGYKVYSDKKAEQNYLTVYNTYIDNLEKAQALMLLGGSDAESLCNLTLKVWGNAIYEERDDETDKYTRPDGYFVSDFNIAIANLFVDSNTVLTISGIEDNKKSVKEILKKLQDVPDGLDKCYDTISELYVAYGTLTDLAVSPSGNYNGFNSNKADAVSDFMSAYSKLGTQIPDKK